MFSKIYGALLTVAYPQMCEICGNGVENRADGVACAVCWDETFIFDGSETLCGKCGRFLQIGTAGFQTFCHCCDEHFYDAARAVGVYEKALASSIIHLKREPFIAERLRKNFLARFEASDFHDSTLIIPVPLSKKRRLERGFNQAAVLAELLAKTTNLPLDTQSLVRTAHTPMHRAAMDNKAREASVENAFQTERPNLVKEAIVLLVDDVFTSGATASACAETLKENGASKVYVLTIARAL